MNSEIVKPKDVISPRQSWTLLRVLDDGQDDGGALAAGFWGNRPVLAARWNGTEDKPKGNPISTGCPTWFILPDKHIEAILRSGLLSFDNIQYVRTLMSLNLIDTFLGRVITTPRKRQYQIRRIERVSALGGRDYIVHVEPMLFLEQEPVAEKSSLSEDAHLFKARPLTFQVHFDYSCKPDWVLFKSGEEADGNLIVATLTNCLDNDPNGRTRKNEDGHYLISFP